MKRILVMTLAVAILAIGTPGLVGKARAQDSSVGEVTLAWDKNTETDLAGYKLHWGLASGNYSNVIDVGKTPTPESPEYTLGNIPREQEVFYAATAYDDSGNESLFSNEVKYTLVKKDTTPPGAPVIRIKAADGTIITQRKDGTWVLVKKDGTRIVVKP